MTPLIELQNLSRNYGPIRAVDDISFVLGQGEILGLLGPNGAGKSTSMQMICGCLSPSSGRILIKGTDLLKHPRQAKAGLGFLPEHPPLYDDLRVDEYLRFCARLRGLPARKVKGALDRAKSLTSLGGEGRKIIGTLSKGYRQRLGIAQAIIHDPDIIILDEPTSGLDPNQIQEIRSLIEQLAADRGVILSTHILTEVQSLCDRVQILHRGRLVFSERLADLRAPDALLLTLGSPPGTDRLDRLPGVEAVEALGEGRFRLALAEDADPALIAEQAVNGGWQLLQMAPEGQSLEQVFTRLTSEEPVQ